MVEAAKIAYRDYPTVVNEVGESNMSYDNTMSDYARMDSTMQAAQKAIGGSSDTAQLSQSYYWNKVNRKQFDADCQQYYENTVILAVCAQLAIDGCKRLYEVDVNNDIARIRSQPCMRLKKDYPKFMKWTHEIPLTKNEKMRSKEEIEKDRERVKRRINDDIICPMNWLQNALDKIQGVKKTHVIETKEFFIKKPGKADPRQMSKIRKLIQEYDIYTKKIILLIKDEQDPRDYIELLDMKAQEIIDILKKMKISNITTNQLIGVALGVDSGIRNDRKYKDSHKYVRKLLNILYKIDKEKFLNNFQKNI